MERRFFDDVEWAEQHHEELLKTYRDRWVAIYDKKVVAYGLSIQEVEQQAQQKIGKKQIPVYFVESGSNIYAS